MAGLFGAGGLVVIGVGRLSGYNVSLQALGLLFYVVFASVTAMMSVPNKLRDLRSTEYEVTQAFVSAKTTKLTKVIYWRDVTEFEIYSRQRAKYVRLRTTDNKQLYIWNVDLLRPDGDDDAFLRVVASRLGRESD